MTLRPPRNSRAVASHRVAARAGIGVLASAVALATSGGAALAQTRHHAAASIRLTALDPQYAYAIQVGDTIALRAAVHPRGGGRASGSVRFTADNPYDHGCRSVRVARGDTATCYMAFYSPGRFAVTARYLGPHRETASVTLRFTVVPSTSD